MAIKYKKRSAVLEGVCSVEEADELLAWLLENPQASLNLGRCEHLHTAILQVILAGQVRISTPPTVPLLCIALGLESTLEAAN